MQGGRYRKANQVEAVQSAQIDAGGGEEGGWRARRESVRGSQQVRVRRLLPPQRLYVLPASSRCGRTKGGAIPDTASHSSSGRRHGYMLNESAALTHLRPAPNCPQDNEAMHAPLRRASPCVCVFSLHTVASQWQPVFPCRHPLALSSVIARGHTHRTAANSETYHRLIQTSAAGDAAPTRQSDVVSSAEGPPAE